MLVLTRKIGEGIAIGDHVKVIVMQIKGKQVRLGIKAAINTPVHREEVYLKIQNENVSASKTPYDSLEGMRHHFSKSLSEARAPLRKRVRKPS